MKKITLLAFLLVNFICSSQQTNFTPTETNLIITEVFPGQSGTDLTADWFEIHNTGTTAWTSGVDGDLYYDDESADPADADLITGINSIAPNERVIVVIGSESDVVTFEATWSPVVDLSSLKIGYTDGSGLGGGGDAATLWIGDPNTNAPVSTGSYPDTASNDGQSYDIELGAFSVDGNASNAVTTVALGGSSADVPNIASPGNIVSIPNLLITEIFPGQSGTDLTEDWFEIYNAGTTAWVSGIDQDLYYDDDSADPNAADLIEGISDIQSGERVIVIIGSAPDVTTFNTIWNPVVDLSTIKVGYTDGSGQGGGGDAVTLWYGDPLNSSPIASGSYPDTSANDGQSYDLELNEFSEVGNSSFAVSTDALGGDALDTPNIASPGNVDNAISFKITEIFPGQSGTDLTEDWFEILNTSQNTWISGVNDDLYYDDDSADAAAADIIEGLSDLEPGERAIVVIGGMSDATTFSNVWGAVVDLTGIEVGYTDGSGQGSGGDAVTLWLGDPNTTSPIATGSYPDTASNDGQSYDLELGEFSTIGNSNFAVATNALGGDAMDVPNIGSPGNVDNSDVSLTITEIFPGQEGDDLTEDWFEIRNTGTTAWISGVDGDLYYDDESADANTADLIQGITDIQPGERVIVLVTDNTGGEVTTFNDIWSPVVDLTGIEIGFTDGAGLGGGGDAVNVWIGDPLTSSPVATGSYPDTAANDGQSYDIELTEFSTVGNASNAVQTIAQGGDLSDVANIGSPGNVIADNLPIVQFNGTFDSVNENDGNISITVTISEAPVSDVSVDVALFSGGTAIEGTDFNFSTTQILNFASGSTESQSFSIPILNNSEDGSDVFFVLQLINPNNVEVGSLNTFSIYILDDDTEVPEINDIPLGANFLSSYLVDSEGTAEITAYDPNSQRLFVTNSTTIEILDFSMPSAISAIGTITIPANGDGVQSVAVNNGILAAAISSNPSTDNGFILFSDIDGNNQITVEVGSLPDMITFTPDGTKLLVANEGEPNSDYTIDPEGSVSIINVTGGLSGIDQSDVTNLNFNSFDAQQADLMASGVRIFGPGATVSQDLEPEYIAVADDNLFAYVALQENNAYAIVDIVNETITDIVPFGLKDHSLLANSLDTSDETDFIFNASWPIYGMYMPDAIAYYAVNGTGYVVTANEGDARDYNGFAEERKLDDDDYNLDPAVFSNADILALETNLGDINVSIATGNTDADPEFEEIHVYGGRSFSIFEADSGSLVFDSGNDFEVITAADETYGGIFNASNSNNSFKNRSDNKGPEPEGVIVQEINGSYYAFVILERVGGVMMYDVTDPSSPQFLQYLNSRGNVPGVDESGDLGPEGIVFVSAEDSPNGTAMLVISNEVSATISVYSLDNITFSLEDEDLANKGFNMYPNPAITTLSFTKIDDYTFYDISGRPVMSLKETNTANISHLSNGIYLVSNSNGQTRKLVVK